MKLLRFVLAGMLLVNTHGTYANDNILNENQRETIGSITYNGPLMDIENATHNIRQNVFYKKLSDHKVTVLAQLKSSEALYAALTQTISPVKALKKNRKIWNRLIGLQRIAPKQSLLMEIKSENGLKTISKQIKAYANELYYLALEFNAKN